MAMTSLAAAPVALAHHHIAQRAIVHVDGAPPADALHRESGLEPMEKVVVEHRREQCVGARHGVHVSREVQVDALGRGHHRSAAADGSALDAEDGSQRRLPQRADGMHLGRP
jgi:hypothetical protein